MLKNYFKIAFRNLSKNKIYGFINVTGLAIGMAVALLIGLWIWDELTFDHYHPNHGRLAQVWDTQLLNGQIASQRDVAIPLAAELRTHYASDFKYIARASRFEDQVLAVSDKKIRREGMWAEPDLPEMLTLKMQKGSRDGLKDPSSILLTASLARTLFGDNDPLNKTIRIDSQWEVKVAGVFEDLPYNTTFHRATFFLSWDKFVDTHLWVKGSVTQWDQHYGVLFVQLNEHGDLDKTTVRIKDIPEQHLKQGKEHLLLHPMDRWHLYNEFRNGKATGGRIQFVWLFGIIGIFVLLLACINFMNLSTARSERRAKEVGIRKTMGSLRGQLIGQFLSESIVVAFLALTLALVLTQLSLPFFNHLASKQMSIPWSQPLLWISIFSFTLFTGLVSGSYPAFYLSAFDPIKVLKGTFRAGPYASLPRKVLVVIQFTVSITLAIGTLIVFRQIQFARNRPVGYDRERLVSVNLLNNPHLQEHYESIRNDLLRTGLVDNTTGSAGPQTDVWSVASDLDWNGKDPNAQPVFGAIAITHDYGRTIGWKMAEGRDFSREFPTDSGALIFNEAAVKLAGLQHPIGQIIKSAGHDHAIIGVVKDMVMNSPYELTVPTVFFLNYSWINYITIRIKRDIPIQDALAGIEKVFKNYNPDGFFDYQFTDEDYASKFAAEQRIGNLATFFAILALFISCLGLFGLASFVAEQRTKEIGVRKVLGATVFNLWKMLSKDFVVLVIISCLIAIPISSYFLDQWLQKYAYHTLISGWVFALAGLGALLITLLTVSYQAIRAAGMNPVKSLRTE